MTIIPILFENEDFLAVNKPEGLVSNAWSGENSLMPHVLASYSGRLYIVHRLDKEVSGVLAFAKNAEAHRFLSEAFSRGEIKKNYMALVLGRVEKKKGLIDKPLREFGSGRMAVDPARGKPSRTEFEVRKRLKDTTLLMVRPLTGRRHQIRVHLYSIGHPVAGDLKYGDRKVQETYLRLMLHALDITLPLRGGGEVRVNSPIPDSFDLKGGHNTY